MNANYVNTGSINNHKPTCESFTMDNQNRSEIPTFNTGGCTHENTQKCELKDDIQCTIVTKDLVAVEYNSTTGIIKLHYKNAMLPVTIKGNENIYNKVSNQINKGQEVKFI